MSKKILTLDNVPVINKKIGKIDTIEKLKASTIYSLGDVVEVLGFHAKGDGAHHKRIAKDKDDGSGELGQNGIWWCVVHSGEVNVSWLGAKGDGVTDDSNSIKKALMSSEKVEFNKEKYLINTPIIVDNIKLKYINFNFSKIRCNDLNNYNNQSGSIINIKPSLNITIENAIFDNENNFAYAGIVIRDTDKLIMRNCTFERFKYDSVNQVLSDDNTGKYISHSCCIRIQDVKEASLNNVFFEDCWRFAKDGTEVTYTSSSGDTGKLARLVQVYGNKMERLFIDGLKANICRIGILCNPIEKELMITNTNIIESNDNPLYLGTNKSNVIISDCNIHTTDEGLVMNNEEGGKVFVNDCIFEAGNKVITFHGNIYNLSINNCKLYTDAGDLIRFRSGLADTAIAKNLKVSNCFFNINTGFYGTYLSGTSINCEFSENTYIIGNKTETASTYDIGFNNQSNCIIRDNIFDKSKAVKISSNGSYVKGNVNNRTGEVSISGGYFNENPVMMNIDDILTFGTGVSTLSSLPNFIRVDQENKAIDMCISLVNGNETEGFVLATLNEKFRPAKNVSSLCSTETDYLFSVITKTNGDVTLNKKLTGTSRGNRRFVDFKFEIPNYTQVLQYTKLSDLKITMQLEGVYDDYVAYRDELHEHEKAQNQEEDTVLLAIIQEPKIPESIKKFTKEYNLI